MIGALLLPSSGPVTGRPAPTDVALFADGLGCWGEVGSARSACRTRGRTLRDRGGSSGSLAACAEVAGHEPESAGAAAAAGREPDLSPHSLPAMVTPCGKADPLDARLGPGEPSEVGRLVPVTCAAIHPVEKTAEPASMAPTIHSAREIRA